MNLKKIFAIILLFILTIWNTSANFFQVSKSGWNTKNVIQKKQISKIILKVKNIDKTPVNLAEIFDSFASYYDWKIPKSYKYIDLKITWINKNSKLYEDLQKLVYADIFPNVKWKINPDAYLTAYQFYKLSEKLFKINVIPEGKIDYLKRRKTTKNDLDYLKWIILNKQEKNINFDFKPFWEKKDISEKLQIKEKIFDDVYKTIKNDHYDKKSITDEILVDWAIQGLAEATKDKFTTYFPPAENKGFQESLNWEFEWIGSYVEMEKPGILKIISPLPGSPSEKAGIKWGDVILEVNWKKITKKTSITEAISWIKWPKWTSVELTILRNKKQIKIKVVRDKIVIKSVEYKKLDNHTFYIKLLIFDSNIAQNFKEALKALKKEKNITKVIIDLRNNWGWFLDQVSDMLWNFAPKDLPTVVVKYRKWEQKYYSKWYNIVDFSKYKIVLLQNGWTASASEIFIGTVKDYFPKAIILGEQSYWKGSVQTIKSYRDGSSFKYTIAHWFTGKSQTWINWVGITPDKKLEFDFEKYKKTKLDNQLEEAKRIK